MNETHYIAARVMPLSWARLAQMGAHGRRETGAAHCDPQRRHLNRYGADVSGQDGRDPLRCIRELVKRSGAVQRANVSRIAAEVLLIISPGWFGDPVNPDPARVDEFERRALEFARQRWPGQLAAFRIDLDESTPSVSLFVCPISHRKARNGSAKAEISYRDAFGHPQKLRQLQTDLAVAFADLGLVRGRPKEETGAVHRRPAEMRADLALATSDAEHARSAARSMVGQLVLQERRIEGIQRLAEANGSAARADRAEAAQLLGEARSLLDFVHVIASQARSLLPGLVDSILKSAETAVAETGRLFHLLNEFRPREKRSHDTR